MTSSVSAKMSNGKFPYSFSVRYLYAGWSLYIIKREMYNWMKIQIRKLYSALSAPVAASRDALAERLQSIRDTTSLLYNRMMSNIGYGQETLKDIVENTAKEEEQEAVIELTKDGKKIKVFRITRSMNRDNTKIIMGKITEHIEMRTKVVYAFKAEIHRGGRGDCRLFKDA